MLRFFLIDESSDRSCGGRVPGGREMLVVWEAGVCRAGTGESDTDSRRLLGDWGGAFSFWEI